MTIHSVTIQNYHAVEKKLTYDLCLKLWQLRCPCGHVIIIWMLSSPLRLKTALQFPPHTPASPPINVLLASCFPVLQRGEKPQNCTSSGAACYKLIYMGCSKKCSEASGCPVWVVFKCSITYPYNITVLQAALASSAPDAIHGAGFHL